MVATRRQRSNVRKEPTITSNNNLNKNLVNNRTISKTSLTSKEIAKSVGFNVLRELDVEMNKICDNNKKDTKRRGGLQK